MKSGRFPPRLSNCPIREVTRRTVTSFKLKVGRWFYCVGYVVVPRSRQGLEWLRSFAIECGGNDSKKRLAEGPLDDATRHADQFERFDQATEVLKRSLIHSREFAYNRQLNWSLQEVPAKSLKEALRIAGEFLECARYAGGEFDWDLSWGMNVRRHAWKHTLYRHIEKSFEAFEDLPQLLLSCLGPHPDRVFENAAHRDPAAVARVNHLFHASRRRMLAAAEHLFNDETAQAIVSQIPTVGELAADLAYVANRDPDSKMAEAARSKSKTLLSKKAATGPGGRAGRSPVQYDKETIRHVFEISYALHKQVKKVDKFLRPFLGLRDERNSQLAKYFPDLWHLLGERLSELAEQQPTQSAYRITAAALKISSSKVEKTVYD